jgi:DNA-binding NarL/FixJ family response regulator
MWLANHFASQGRNDSMTVLERENSMTIRIVVADDHHVVRRGVRGFLEIEPELTVVGEAADGMEAITLVEQLQPDVIIADLFMPVMDGFALTRQVVKRWPNVRVLVLTMDSDRLSVQKALACGVLGYVLKDSGSADLNRAIHDVMAGRRYLSPLLAERAIEAYMGNGDDAPPQELSALTEREHEVLKLAAMGRSSTKIAT